MTTVADLARPIAAWIVKLLNQGDVGAATAIFTRLDSFPTEGMKVAVSSLISVRALKQMTQPGLRKGRGNKNRSREETCSFIVVSADRCGQWPSVGAMCTVHHEMTGGAKPDSGSSSPSSSPPLTAIALDVDGNESEQQVLAPKRGKKRVTAH